MISVKIRALKDFRLNTTVEKRSLVKGEVTTVKFKNKQQVGNLLKFGNFVEAKPGEPEKRVIPIIKKPKPLDKEKPRPGLDGDFYVEDYLTNRMNGNQIVEETEIE